MVLSQISKKVWIPVLILVLLGGLYGGSYGIIQNVITSRITAPTSTESPKISNLTILAMGDHYITINLQIELPEQSQQPISIQLKTTSIYINTTLIGFLALIPPSTIVSFKNSIFNIPLNFTIPDQTLFHQVLQNIINEADLLLRIETKLFIAGLGRIYPPFSLNFEDIISTSSSQQSSSFFSMQFKEFTIDTTTGKLHFFLNISIQNPLNNSIQIKAFQGNLTFNDPDGAFLKSPANHIKLLDLDFTWTDPPFLLPSNGIGTQIIEIEVTTTLDSAYRLFDEYVLNERLIINIESAIISLQIVDYLWEFPFFMTERNVI